MESLGEKHLAGLLLLTYEDQLGLWKYISFLFITLFICSLIWIIYKHQKKEDDSKVCVLPASKQQSTDEDTLQGCLKST